MAQYLTYQKMLNDLDSILTGYEKKAAEELRDDNVLSGNGQATDGQGKPAGEPKKETDIATPEPSKTDDGTKSVNYPVTNGNEAKQVNNTIKSESEAEKVSKHGNDLLKQIYSMLHKKAQDDEAPKEEPKKEESNGKDEVKDKIKELADEVGSESELEVEVSPEEQKKLDEMGASEEEKVAYVLSKQAGYKFASELRQAGVLGGTSKEEEMDKVASFNLGRVIAQLENAGLVAGPAALEKISSDMGVMARALSGKKQTKTEKKASVSQESDHEIVKKASATTTESVIHDLIRRDIGTNLNRKLSGIVNP